MASAHHADEKVAAVVIGSELNGLGVVRSMARERVPIIAVDTASSRAALWSRHAKSRLFRSFIGREFVDDMIRLGKEFEHPPVLLLTAEEAVRSVSENRDELSKWFRFRLPTDEKVKLLSSKAQFHDFALRHDFPVPRTAILESRSDIGLLDQLRFPCVLKPDDKRNVLSGQKERAVRVGSLRDARAHASAMLGTPGGIVAQEWIEGPESNIYFTLFYRGADGHIAGVFTGRKIACYPRDVGSTAVCIAAPEAREALEPLTLAFAERAGFDGMGSMEYKWDENRKAFFMVEPTVGRTDWQEEIATLCGVNLPVAAYRYELGLPVVHDGSGRVPAAWRATFIDRAPRALLTAHTKVVDGYFRWNDPLPALKFYCLDHPLRRIIRRWHKRNQERDGNASLNEAAECEGSTQ
ncbi:carboxylate--amine ligase [Trinickia mobilis]|uniref:carboxylate--amine ligase n=1 Tax=Trinickia mobilis TaxID=2816356 RepID=UPI001A8D907F|nr:carboxylate--amine ligase [Trinickia mobilis]